MKRDIQIDAIRGFCLILMTVSHIEGPVNKLTFEFIGFAGGAEAFVFLSGMVAGLVYAKRSLRVSESELNRAAFGRIWTLYRYHVGAYLLILGVAALLPALARPWAGYAPLFFENMGLAFLLGPLLLYQPLFIDLLPMYCLFIALTPAAIRQFQKGRETIWLGASVGLWFFTQFGVTGRVVEHTLAKIIEPQFGFNAWAWQMIYFIGLWVGFRKHRDGRLFRDYNKVLLWLCGSLAVVLFLIRHALRVIRWVESHGSTLLDPVSTWLPEPATRELIADLTFKLGMRPLRVVNFFVVVYVISYLLERYKPLIHAKWMIFVGQHSLECYAYHLPLVYGIRLFEGNLLDPEWAVTPYLLGIITVLAVASLTIPAEMHRRHREARAAEKPRGNEAGQAKKADSTAIPKPGSKH